MKKVWQIIEPVVEFIVLKEIICLVGLILLQTGRFPVYQDKRMIAIVVINAVSMIVAFFVMFGWNAITKQDHIVFQKNIPTWDLANTIFLGASSSIALNIFFSKLQIARLSNNYEHTVNLQYSVPIWLGVIIYGIIAPIAEEYVFRGLFMSRVKRVLGRKEAIILSSLAFGIYHGNWIQGVYAFCIGILLALCYEVYGSLWLPFLLHSTSILTAYVVSSFPF